jgi:hypothetical protein
MVQQSKSHQRVLAASKKGRCNSDDLLVVVEDLAIRIRKSLSGEKVQPGVPFVVAAIENRGAHLTGMETAALSSYLSARLLGGSRISLVPGKAGARYGVLTNLARVGDKCILTSQLVDFKKSGTAKTASVKTDCFADSVIDAVGQIADKLSSAVKKL